MLRRFMLFVAASLTALTLTGCKQIEMKNGEVPAAFLDQARKAEGVYTGHIEESDGSGLSKNLREATMVLKFEGTRPVLTISTDILGENCGSKLGEILNVQVSGLKVKRAAFAFDAGKCANADISDRMMIDIHENPDGKFSLNVWVMTGSAQIIDGTKSTAGTEPVIETSVTLTKGHFRQN